MMPHVWVRGQATAEGCIYRCSRCHFAMFLCGWTEKTSEATIQRTLELGARTARVESCDVTSVPPTFVLKGPNDAS